MALDFTKIENEYIRIQNAKADIITAMNKLGAGISAGSKMDEISVNVKNTITETVDDGDLSPENIREGVEIFGIRGSYTGVGSGGNVVGTTTLTINFNDPGEVGGVFNILNIIYSSGGTRTSTGNNFIYPDTSYVLNDVDINTDIIIMSEAGAFGAYFEDHSTNVLIEQYDISGADYEDLELSCNVNIITITDTNPATITTEC